MNQEQLRKETAEKIAIKHGLYHSFTKEPYPYAIDALLEMAQWEADREKWIDVNEK